ncbi:signal peptide peptidase SppA [Cyclobacterium qasimii]|uniref:Protease IV n=2 Tax=Cyclobacterium qasimii TaxID=1350429 RepID=S7WWZ4_9BACT|nr:signal peptide peptidase SppA [Cyclobacterium qasimii]EPR71279.1 Protease IV [Cyclobacterium qasimii M12-11B]GEO23305.1 signal peptide peptidase SppA [Cyclobacterium qasimii]
MKFLSNVLAVIVGLLIFWVIGFFMLAGIIAISSSGDQTEIEENSVLHIKLNGIPIVESAPDDDIGLPPLPYIGNTTNIGLNQIIKAIRTAADNDDIKGIYLESGMLTAGQAHILEIRNALNAFKEKGKFIISYSEYYSEPGYFLSSVADEIYLNPIGDIEFNGFSSAPIFFKGLFEKLEIEPVIFRVGEFKSAIEPFILDKMSEENRLQTMTYLNDMNTVMVENVANSRNLEVEKVREINDGMLVRNGQDALDFNLIDGLWYDDQVITRLKEKLDISDEDEDINTIGITAINQSAKSKNRLSENTIALIIADGEIVGGEAIDQISSDRFLKEIRKARKNEDVKAIVIRINSPGGSVVASEVIWRELSEAQKEKPLIASMSNYAASGGYYIAAPADTIVAYPNTITGSIGIFGLWFNAKGLLNNKLGITTDEVSTGTYSNLLDPTKTISEAEKAIMQKKVEEGYDTFISRVSEGRNMSREQVLAIAGGRVWSGKKAKENGLVDVLGDFDDAIEIAANKAGIADDYRLVVYPKQKSVFEQLIEDLGGDVQSTYQRIKMGYSYEIFNTLEKIEKLQGRMVLLPFQSEIK